MIVRRITNENDWTFGKGKNNYLTDSSAVAQNVKTRLQSFLGDCFFSLQSGIDWFNLLGSKEQVKLRLAISTTILNTDNVTKLNELTVDVSEDRKISISYSISTIYGQAQETVLQEF